MTLLCTSNKAPCLAFNSDLIITLDLHCVSLFSGGEQHVVCFSGVTKVWSTVHGWRGTASEGTRDSGVI